MLPTYAQIGVWAPVLLIVLRILQGFSAGGEWGGAALLAVEHAPPGRRSLFGAFPQIGTPVGLIVATLMLLGLTSILGRDAFQAYGWRVSFLLSLRLIVVGYVIRRRVEESRVFALMQQRRRDPAAPLRQLFRENTREVVLPSLIFVGNNAAGYLLLAFLISYGQTAQLRLDCSATARQLSYGQTALHLPQGQVLMASTFAAVAWLASTLVGGVLGDRLGQVRTFQIGYVFLALWAIPMWFLLDGADITLFCVTLLILAVPLGLTYGPQASLYASMFPARVRYSDVSIGYALGSILGGAFAPTTAQGLLSAYGRPWLIGAYLVVLSLVSLKAVSLVGQPARLDLDASSAH